MTGSGVDAVTAVTDPDHHGREFHFTSATGCLGHSCPSLNMSRLPLLDRVPVVVVVVLWLHLEERTSC